MKIIARFKTNNKEYVYYLFNNTLYYGYIVGNDICTELTDEEISLMNDLFQKITISKNPKNHINISTIKYHQKNYQIIFDKISELKYVLEITPYGLKDPVFDDIKELMYFLNDETSYIKLNMKTINDAQIGDVVGHVPKDIMIRRKVGNTVCTIYLSVTLTFITLMGPLVIVNKINPEAINSPVLKPAYTIAQDLNEFITESDNSKIFTGEPISYEEIVTALNKNEGLPQKYKDRVIANADALIDNYSLIAKNEVLERISTVKVIEAYGLNKELGVRSNIAGFYHPLLNFITLLTDEYNNMIIDHELFHMFGYGNVSLGNALYEGTNEIYAIEYSNDVGFEGAYGGEKLIVKLLMEIIGAEPFKKLEFKCDISDVLSGLTEINNDEQMAYETIGMIDTLLSTNNSLYSIEENEDYKKELMRNRFDLLEKIVSNISKYYEAKYRRDINEDMVCAVYLNNLSMEPKELYVDDIEAPVYSVEKAYFRQLMIDELQDGIYRFANQIAYKDTIIKYSIEEALERKLIVQIQNEDGSISYRDNDPCVIIVDNTVEYYDYVPYIIENQNPIKITPQNRYKYFRNEMALR